MKIKDALDVRFGARVPHYAPMAFTPSLEAHSRKPERTRKTEATVTFSLTRTMLSFEENKEEMIERATVMLQADLYDEFHKPLAILRDEILSGNEKEAVAAVDTISRMMFEATQ